MLKLLAIMRKNARGDVAVEDILNPTNDMRVSFVEQAYIILFSR